MRTLVLHFLTILVFWGFLLPVPAFAIVKPPTALGLVAYWSFNEGNGTVATDFSGNGNAGTLSGSTLPSWVPGKRGKALSFNGSTARVPVTDSSSLDVTSVTMAAWVYLDSASGNTWIFDKGNALTYTTGYAFLLMDQGNGTDKIRGFIGTGSNNSVDSNTAISTGRWVHLAVTYDQSNVRHYIDGVLDNTTPITGAISVNTNNLSIGSRGDSNEFINGKIDDLRVYNRALSASEVTALYHSGAVKLSSPQNTKMTNGLVGMWSFNGPDIDWSTNTIYDRSGQGNNATASGMSTTTAPIAGKVGQALNFDGVNDYVNIGNTSTYALTTYTISGWFKTSDKTTFPTITARNVDSSARSWWITIWDATAGHSAGQLVWRTSSAGVVDVDIASSANFADNIWHHFAAVLNGSTSATLYVDGARVAQDTTIGVVDTPNTSAEIGREKSIAVRFFTGLIDEVRIYNRALTVSEVKQLYQLGLGAKILPEL